MLCIAWCKKRTSGHCE